MTRNVRAGMFFVALLAAAWPLHAQARPYLAVTAGGQHTCAITAAAAVVCWGRGDSHQLGVKAEEGFCRYACKLKPTLATGGDFRMVTAGTEHTCALMNDGLALCTGQATEGYPQQSFTPVEGGPWAAISAGTRYTCAVAAADSTGWCWGRGKEGQLGTGSLTDVPVPQRVSGDLQFLEIAAGKTSTCGLSVSRAAWCWGRGREGQLGNGAVTDSPVPVEVQGGRQYVHVEVGAQHACGLGVDSTVACWGRANGGGLLPGVKKNSPVPVVLEGRAFKSVAAGDWFTCALAADASVYCWGSGTSELGNSSTGGTKWRPVQGGDLKYGFRSIEVGGGHACGIAMDYSLWCWGDALNGELGNGAPSGGAGPQRVLLPPR